MSGTTGEVHGKARPGPKASSCGHCRAAKLRCDRGDPCLHCSRKNLLCTYEEDLSPTAKPKVAYGRKRSETETRGDTEGRRKHVEQTQDPPDLIIEELRERIKHLELRLARSEAAHHQNANAKRVSLADSLGGDNRNSAESAATTVKMSYPVRNFSHPAFDSRSFTASASASLAVLDNQRELTREPEKVARRPDPILELIWPGWPLELPEPSVVVTMCELFFARSPMRGAIHKPSFMYGLLLPINSLDRPHQCLIHAILSAAAPLSPYFRQTGQKHAGAVLPSLGDLRTRQAPDDRHLDFAEFHMAWARLHAERAVIVYPRNPLDWCQTVLLLCVALMGMNRLKEMLLYSSYTCRFLSPCGLDKILPFGHPETHRMLPGILGHVHSTADEDERRKVFWYVYINDVYTSGPVHMWEANLSDDQVLTCLPILRHGDGSTQGGQMLDEEGLFILGPRDAFTLEIKSAVLIKRVQLLLTRNRIHLGHALERPSGFWELDRAITSFLSTFPRIISLDEEISFGLVSAYSNANVALLYLHEHFNSTPPSQLDESQLPRSVKQMLYAIDNIVEVVNGLLSTSVDLVSCHPHNHVCWSVAARLIARQIDWCRVLGQEQRCPDLYLKFDSIVELLNRAAPKSLRARKFVEQLLRVRAGVLSESMYYLFFLADTIVPD